MKTFFGIMAFLSIVGCFSVGGMIEAETVDFALGAILLLVCVGSFGIFARRATK